MKHASASFSAKYAPACFELGEGNYQLLEWKTDSASVVYPWLTQGHKILTTCYFLISKSHIMEDILEGRTGIPGLWTQELDAGLCTLDSGRWTLDTEPWTLDSGRWTLDAGLWTLDPGRWTLGAGHWTLESGRWILDAGLWTLDAGHWTLVLMTVLILCS